jgi:hypothetical protein
MPPAGTGNTRSLFVNKSAERARFTWQIAQVHPSPAFIYFADVTSFIFRVEQLQFQTLMFFPNFLSCITNNPPISCV